MRFTFEITKLPIDVPCFCPSSMASRKCMPPYKRERAASSAASRKKLKVRGGSPKYSSDVSVNLNLSPKKELKTSAAAADTTLCPLVYSGNGGVCNKGVHSALTCLFIAVCGRIRSLLYFSSQQLIKAWCRTRASIAWTAAVLRKEAFA